MLPAAIAAIDATKPYLGGNDTLWRLHKLNNVDKHRLLITVGFALRSLDVGSYISQRMGELFPNTGGSPIFSLFLRPADRLFPMEVGDEIFSHPLGEGVKEMSFRFDVAFGEPGVIDGEPLLEALQKMINAVEQLVGSFEPLV